MGKKTRDRKQIIQTQAKPPASHTSLAMAVFVGLCLLVFYPPYFALAVEERLIKL
ncbi:MAG: hypothetical protein DDT19_01443 [Syntrophomonadaceae bacterium]|nr:hypothetical protein [Bacillota bacterium]